MKLKEKLLKHNLTFIKAGQGNFTIILKTQELQDKATTLFK